MVRPESRLTRQGMGDRCVQCALHGSALCRPSALPRFLLQRYVSGPSMSSHRECRAIQASPQVCCSGAREKATQRRPVACAFCGGRQDSAVAPSPAAGGATNIVGERRSPQLAIGLPSPRLFASPCQSLVCVAVAVFFLNVSCLRCIPSPPSCRLQSYNAAKTCQNDER